MNTKHSVKHFFYETFIIALGCAVFAVGFDACVAPNHFAIGGMPDVWCMLFCILSTLLWARIAAKFANQASPKTVNRATGIVLVVLGVAIIGVNLMT